MGKRRRRRPAGDAAVVLVGIQVLELEAVDDAAAVPEQQVREDEDEHPVRLLAPAELDDRVPCGEQAARRRRRRRRDLMGYRRPQWRPGCLYSPRTGHRRATVNRRRGAAGRGCVSPRPRARRRRAPPNLRRAGASSSGRRRPGCSAMAIGDAGTLRRDLLLLQVRDGPAEHALAGSRRFRHGARCFVPTQGSLVAVMPQRVRNCPDAGRPRVAATDCPSSPGATARFGL